MAHPVLGGGFSEVQNLVPFFEELSNEGEFYFIIFFTFIVPSFL